MKIGQMKNQKRCPCCKKVIIEYDPKLKPFCSARCKDVDLGTWLDEGYTISRPLLPFELSSNVSYLVPPEDDDNDNI